MIYQINDDSQKSHNAYFQIWVKKKEEYQKIEEKGDENDKIRFAELHHFNNYLTWWFTNSQLNWDG